jgi:hypothetical protein
MERLDRAADLSTIPRAAAQQRPTKLDRCHVRSEVSFESGCAVRREADPYPWSWELPAVCFAVVLCVALSALHAGRSVAFAVGGRGWVWPASDQLLTSVPHLLAGQTTSGLGAAVAPVAPPLVAVGIAVTELIAFGGLGLLSWQLLVRFGPNALRGVASSAEANRLLGRSRLSRVRKVVRPDLCASLAKELSGGGAR